MKYLILSIAFATLINAEIFNTPCRTPEQLGVQIGFVPSDYLGTWYEIERYEQRFQAGAECSVANYALNEDGSIQVINSAVFIENGTRIQEEGFARISFPDEDPLRAMLNVTFSSLQPNRSNYWVLSTDYVNYAFVVSCSNLPLSRSFQSYWLLSRTTVLTPAIRQRADALIQRFLDASRIRTTIQDNNRCNRVARHLP